MTVEELIAKLGRFPGNAEVHFAYNYGDYWSTTVAPSVTSVYEGEVEHSDYHNMDKLVELRDDEDDESEPDVRLVVILE